mmetsp:Transcript_114789/g.357542  ORF Transcript_114789/g.357542 Transcript_114789/m.357542 type:complete len:108 (+) Transcript_114789:60-383(+)
MQLAPAGRSPRRPELDGPLLEAAWLAGQEEVLRSLRAGPILESRSTGGGTPLHHAAFSGQAGLAAELLDARAGLAAQDRSGDGASPLHCAALAGHCGLLRAIQRECP